MSKKFNKSLNFNYLSSNVSFGSISASTFTGSNLSISGSISSVELYSNNITGGNIVGTTISAGTLLATLITGGNLSISGTVTAGNLLGSTINGTNSTITNAVHTALSTGTLNATTSVNSAVVNATTRVSSANLNSSAITTGTIYITSSDTWQTGLNITNNNNNTWQLNVGGSTNNAVGINNIGLFNGTYRMVVTSTGNIGIGTGTPESKLHVNGAITIEGETVPAAGGTIIDSSNLNQTYITFKPNGSSNDWAYLRQIGSSNNYLMALDIHDDGDEQGFCIRSIKSTDTPDTVNERFRVQANGNVGIGTSSPATTLDVSGTFRATTSVTTGLLNATNVTATNVVATTISSGTILGTTLISSANVAASLVTTGTLRSSSIVLSGSSSQVVTYPLTNGLENAFAYYNNTLASGDATRWVVGVNVQTGVGNYGFWNSSLGRPALMMTSTGNIGIGTTSPNSALTIFSTAGSSNIESGNSGISINSSLTYATASLYMGADATNNIGWISASRNGAYSNLILNPRGGSVGINTTSPATTLDVTGTFRATTSITTGLLNATNVTATNVVATTISSGTILGTNIVATAISAGTLVGTTITGANLSLSGNLVVGGTLTTVNITTTNVVDTNISAGTLTATNINVTTISAGTLVGTLITGGNLSISGTVTAGRLLSTNITATNIVGTTAISSGTILATTRVSSANLNSAAITTGTALVSNSSPELIIENTNYVNNGTSGIKFANTGTASAAAYIRCFLAGLNVHDLQFIGHNGSNNLTAMTIKGSGNVGIGTTVPDYKLQATSTISVTPIPSIGEARYHLYNGGAQAEWKVGQKSSSRHDYCITKVVSGSETDYLSVGVGGNVGIGTTSPSYTLDVTGTCDVSTSITTAALYSTNITATNIVGTIISSGTLVGTLITGGNLSISGTVTVGTLLATTRVSSANLNSSAVSTGTLNATGSMTVGNTLIFNSDPILTVKHNSGSSSVNSGTILLQQANNTGVQLRYEGNTSADMMTIRALTGGVTTGTVVVIKNTGTGIMGINTTSPSCALDISNGTTSSNAPFLRLSNSAGGAGNQVGIRLNPYSGRAGGESSQIIAIDDGAASSHLTFYTASGDAGTSTERMRIMNNGYVGVGTQNPRTYLEISGTGIANGLRHTNNTCSVETYNDGNSGWLQTYTNHPLKFSVNNGTPLMILNTNGNFGIGTETPNASVKLQVLGKVGIGESVLTDSGRGILDIKASSVAYSSGTLMSEYALTISHQTVTNGSLGIAFGVTGTSSVTPGASIIFERTASTNVGLLHFCTRSGALTTSPNVIRMTVQTTGNVGIGTTAPTSTLQINGSLAKTSGTFDIKHPIVADKRLVHSFIEGPRCDLIYRGKITLQNGQATVNLDTDCVQEQGSEMTQGTFEALCTNPDYYLQNNSSFDRIHGSISGNILTIVCENSSSTDKISWMVVAERKDTSIKEWDRTNSNGFLITEYSS